MVLDVQVLQRYLEENLPIYSFIGLQILEADPEGAKCFVPLSRNNTNHFGSVHAAVQWAMAEVLGGVISFPNFGGEDILTVVKEVTIRFERPAMTDLTSETSIGAGEIQRIKGDLAEGGKADFTLDIEVKDSSGTTVARVTGLYHTRRKDLYEFAIPETA